MSGRIPEDVIDKIREEIAIEDVVGHYVTLVRKGTSLWACCPFHDEKTPSFHVRPDHGTYYCFGCQRGGGVFRFLQEKEGMSFPEAVEWCADRLGIDLDRYRGRPDDGPDPRQALLRANAFAAEWFAQQLHTPAGAEALDYARARGLQDATIERFGLGYAPADGRALGAGAEKAKIALESLVQASLMRRSEGRAPFAYFRSRLIFPIRGVAQKIHGFGGRILGPGEPKYLNSPESPVFRKRRTLYALPEARSAMVKRREAILVEGYLDALLLHQAGWGHCVATCGTAFTPEQAQLLGRWVDRLILLFDGDAAGRKAAFRSADVALAAGLDVKIARLPAGRDPADLVVDGEGELLAEVLTSAPGLVESMRLEVAARGNDRMARERALHHLREAIGRVSDPIRAELLLEEAAEGFGVEPTLLRRPQGTGPSRTAPSPAGLAARNDPALPADPGGHEPAEPIDPQIQEIEERLVRLALLSRRSRRFLLERHGADAFLSPVHAEVVRFLQGLPESTDAVDGRHLDDRIDARAQALVARAIEDRPESDFDPVPEIEGQLERLRIRRKKVEARQRRERMDAAFLRGENWTGDLTRSPRAGSDNAHPTEHSDRDPDGGTSNR